MISANEAAYRLSTIAGRPMNRVNWAVLNCKCYADVANMYIEGFLTLDEHYEVNEQLKIAKEIVPGLDGMNPHKSSKVIIRPLSKPLNR